MRLLIDTQIFIWAVIDSDHLSEHARRIMLDAAEVFVSAASIWEIAIKAKLGKIEGARTCLQQRLLRVGSVSSLSLPATPVWYTNFHFIIATRSIDSWLPRHFLSLLDFLLPTSSLLSIPS